jgi:pyrroline-5-carboxylate reductase
MTKQNVGFLGSGNMATALLRGLAALPEQFALHASDVRAEKLTQLAADVVRHPSNAALMGAVSVLVLAVKPQSFDAVLSEVHEHLRKETLVISVAAGVPIAAIEARLPEGTRVVRSMPNTPASVQAGATAIALGSHATAEDVTVARAIFESVGRVVELEEALLDAVTGLSGSGPAYVMLMIEALADGGVKVGLHRDTALMLAAQTVYGSAKLLLDTGEHPGRLKDMVTSPGGTAIAGLHTLESGALRKTLIDAVEAATKRSEELGVQISKKLEPRKA